jgi:hypothetical protein
LTAGGLQQAGSVGEDAGISGDEVSIVRSMLLLEIDEERSGFAFVEGKWPLHVYPPFIAAS